MRKLFVVAGFFLWLVSGLCQNSLAAELMIYGPQTFKLPKAGNLIETLSFSSSHVGEGAKLKVENGSNRGSKQVDSGSVALNDSQVISAAELITGVSLIEKDVTLTTENTLDLNLNGSFNNYVTVTVFVPNTGSPPPNASISADPATITTGGASTLNWTTTDAETVSIDQGIGPVSAIGSTNISPATTTTYTLIATGPGGTATDSVTVTVDAGSNPPTASITANPSTITIGGTSALNWTTTDADTVSIDQGIGTVSPTGGIDISPDVTTTYTITATGPGGAAIESATVTVDSGQPNSQTIFGPQTYKIPKAGSITDLASFPSAQIGPGGILRIENGSSRGSKRVDSGSIVLNGVEVMSGSELNGNAFLIEKNVSLLASNSLQINLSGAFNSYVVITVETVPYNDVTPPTVESFTLPGSHNAPSVPITSFTASDDVAVTGYLVTDTVSEPAVDNPSWSASPPASFTVVNDGPHTLYGWAKDASGNISTAASAAVTVDTTSPTVTLFEIPEYSMALVIPITSLTATDNIGVVGYLVTATAAIPLSDDPGWSATPPVSYIVTTEGSFTLYAWAKDGLGNISQSAFDSVQVDATRPVVETFEVPPAQEVLDLQITTFTATDNVGVTSFLITESSDEPLLDNPAWSGTPSTSYTVAAEGDFILYAWARDMAGHLSLAVPAPVNVTLPDTTKPIVELFDVPATHNSLDVPIISFTASDDRGVTSYLVTDTASEPLADDLNWNASPQTNYSVTADGSQTLFGWAKDAADNISAGVPSTVNVVLADPTVPVVDAFELPDEHDSLTVPITLFVATDDLAVTGYLVTESPTEPVIDDPNWNSTPPTEFIASGEGPTTLYAWAKDADNQISASFSVPVYIVLPDSTLPTVDIFEVQPVVHVVEVPVAEFSASDDIGVTGYLITGHKTTEPVVAPSVDDPGWNTSPQTIYTVQAGEGDYLLYAWAKDEAGNISNSLSAPVTIFFLDIIPPVIGSFVIPATSDSLTVPIAELTATDVNGVSAYFVSDSAATPPENDPDWVSTPPASYTFSTDGTHTLYAWAKDSGDNISSVSEANVTITLADTTAPSVIDFEIPATHDSLIVPINTLTASDEVGVTGYLITDSEIKPLASNTNWQSTIPATHGFAVVGPHTLYAWAKDAAGNVSSGIPGTVTITLNDTVSPTVDSFAIPISHDTLTIPIMTFTASDNIGVTGYLITELATAPAPDASGWRTTASVSYTAASDGLHTLYAWVKDQAGNVSLGLAADVTITATAGASSVRYYYDDLGRLSRVVAGTAGRVYSYDEVGNLLSITDANIVEAPPVLESLAPEILFVGGRMLVRISGQNLLTTEAITSDNPEVMIGDFQTTDTEVSVYLTATAPGAATLTVVTAYGSADIPISTSDSVLSLSPGQQAILPGETGTIQVSLSPPLPNPVSFVIKNSRPSIINAPTTVTIPGSGTQNLVVEGLLEGVSTLTVGPKKAVVFVSPPENIDFDKLTASGVSVYIDRSDVLVDGAVQVSGGVSVRIEESDVLADGASASSRPVSVYIKPWAAGTTAVTKPVSVYIDSSHLLADGVQHLSKPVSVYIDSPLLLADGVQHLSKPISVYINRPEILSNGAVATSQPVSVYIASTDESAGKVTTSTTPVSVYVSNTDALTGGATVSSLPVSIYIDNSNDQISVDQSTNKVSVEIEKSP